MASTRLFAPRKFAPSKFVKIDIGQKVEEEGIPNYKPEDYYPAHIGDVLNSRYQIVSKLGFGVNSTVWLARDLLQQRYLALKLRVRATKNCRLNGQDDREITISNHLKETPTENFGKTMVRTVIDSFEMTGPRGTHKCLLYQPLGMSFTHFLELLPDHRMPRELFKGSTRLLLIALAYLHKYHIVHTDISPNNILQRLDDDSILSQIEQDELERPIARKVLEDRTIYNSRPIPPSKGIPMVCDLGGARIGNHKHKGDIMPDIYRAPEVILGMYWDTKVDIWAVGVMAWDLLQGGRLFFARRNGVLDDEQHLAEIVSLLGPPPPEFLSRSERCRLYWDDQGNWKGSVPIPDQSFEMRERALSALDQVAFLRFIRRALRWSPEERPTAEELAFDEFFDVAAYQQAKTEPIRDVSLSRLTKT